MKRGEELMEAKKLQIPLKESEIRQLKIGDVVYLSGHIYTARDMAHLRIQQQLTEEEALPKDFSGAAVFHAGPVCLKDGKENWKLNVIGPTTSIRMEPYADLVGRMGVKAVIGKGGMAQDTLNACEKYGYVYLQAAPGCAAKLAVLNEQRQDLTTAIDQLLDDIEAGRKYMKVYRQMKMYNDPATNPILYGKKG